MASYLKKKKFANCILNNVFQEVGSVNSRWKWIYTIYNISANEHKIHSNKQETSCIKTYWTELDNNYDLINFCLIYF